MFIHTFCLYIGGMERVNTDVCDAMPMVITDAWHTVEPPKRGQHGDEPFVLSRGVVLFRRFLFLSLKIKHFSSLDTNTTNKRECNQLSHGIC